MRKPHYNLEQIKELLDNKLTRKITEQASIISDNKTQPFTFNIATAVLFKPENAINHSQQ